MRSKYETGATIFIPDRVVLDLFSKEKSLVELARKYILEAGVAAAANRYIEINGMLGA